jgi:hypothetical protein
MAQAVGAHSYYDEPIATGGNREDLSDMCWDVSPADTPFITAIRKNKATGVLHSWLTDTLSTGAGTSRIEGLDAVAADPTSRSRLTNNTEILTKHSVVTGTQEALPSTRLLRVLRKHHSRVVASKVNRHTSCLAEFAS